MAYRVLYDHIMSSMYHLVTVIISPRMVGLILQISTPSGGIWWIAQQLSA
jgi:hypothetical protein